MPLSRLPLAQRNAVLAFFSFDFESVKFALENYKWNMNDGSTVINQLLEKYSLEGIAGQSRQGGFASAHFFCQSIQNVSFLVLIVPIN